MRSFTYLLYFFMLVTVLACEEEDQATTIESDALFFGHFYGECQGEQCIETFKLTEEALFEDLNDDFPTAGSFDLVELSNDKFELVRDLMDAFPAQLLDESEFTFGCPDCADQGGIYIRRDVSRSFQIWLIDQNKNEVPAYLHDFMDLVNEKIQLINN